MQCSPMNNVGYQTVFNGVFLVFFFPLSKRTLVLVDVSPANVLKIDMDFSRNGTFPDSSLRLQKLFTPSTKYL